MEAQKGSQSVYVYTRKVKKDDCSFPTSEEEQRMNCHPENMGFFPIDQSCAESSAMQKLLEFCKAGKTDHVIISSVYDLGDDLRKFIDITHKLRQLPEPVEVVFKKENLSSFDEDYEKRITVIMKELSFSNGSNIHDYVDSRLVISEHQ